MVDIVIDFLKNIPIPDYVLITISVVFFLVFIFSGIEKIYKAYLGIILGLVVWTFINLSITSLNSNDIGFKTLKNFVFNHKDFLGFYSIFFIPLFAILIPLNEDIEFRVSKNKVLNYLTIISFGLFYFSFLISIFLSIINNKFLFQIDNGIIGEIKESYVLKSIYNYFSPSFIFSFLLKYDYLVNLIIILFIFYKMTIGGVVDYIFNKLFKRLSKIFEEQKKEEPKKEEKKDEHHH
ncbi:hypothetical protein H3C61_04470 [Candidatus Gracilibacteria bacterium]|nr:hypothetical protein [Candidatus Gracilibacteria bacterium]